MDTKRRMILGGGALLVLGGAIVAFPPYRTYQIDPVVRSVVEEVVLPAFPVDTRPVIEWENGSRDLWRDELPSIRFYGLSDREAQSRILEAVRKRLPESNCHTVLVQFFARRNATGSVPIEFRRAFLERK